MSGFKINRSILYALCSVLLCACSLGSNNDFANQAKQSSKQKNNWRHQLEGAVNAASLYDLINIPELNALIQDAMQHNPSLQQSLIALKMAYAQKTATSSAALPELNADFTGGREDAQDSYSSYLGVSWELDVWGKIADSRRGAEKDITSDLASLQSVKDTLAADMMRQWLQISYQKQLIEIQTLRLAVLTNNETIILEQYRAGLGELTDLDTAKSTSLSAQSTLALYQEDLAISERDLTLLLGQLSSHKALNISSDFPIVLTPLTDLPEQDLARRPDLQAAYLNIEAEQARSKAAYKELLPSISLELALSDSGTSPTQALFSNPAWSILGQLSAPIFDGGYLRSQAEIAELTAENSYWIYQETLLNAVKEVEDALGQEKSLALREQYLTQALHSAERSFANYQEKYREGLVDIADLIIVQTNSFDIREQLTDVKYLRLRNRIDLGLALGLGVTQ